MAIVDETYNLNRPYFKNHSYLEWLESYTIDERLSDDRRPRYSYLLRKLWSMPFHGSIGNDDDRGDEGLELRARYNYILAKNSNIDASRFPEAGDIFGECRVLEMLIALSMRMYDLMQDMGVYNSVSRWFWEIMHNVGFDTLDDGVYLESNGDEVVENVVTDILDLRERKSGRPGGWFYVSDWRKLEIWYQMHEYLSRFFR